MLDGFKDFLKSQMEEAGFTEKKLASEAEIHINKILAKMIKKGKESSTILNIQTGFIHIIRTDEENKQPSLRLYFVDVRGQYHYSRNLDFKTEILDGMIGSQTKAILKMAKAAFEFDLDNFTLTLYNNINNQLREQSEERGVPISVFATVGETLVLKMCEGDRSDSIVPFKDIKFIDFIKNDEK